MTSSSSSCSGKSQGLRGWEVLKNFWRLASASMGEVCGDWRGPGATVLTITLKSEGQGRWEVGKGKKGKIFYDCQKLLFNMWSLWFQSSIKVHNSKRKSFFQTFHTLFVFRGIFSIIPPAMSQTGNSWKSPDLGALLNWTFSIATMALWECCFRQSWN